MKAYSGGRWSHWQGRISLETMRMVHSRLAPFMDSARHRWVVGEDWLKLPFGGMDRHLTKVFGLPKVSVAWLPAIVTLRPIRR